MDLDTLYKAAAIARLKGVAIRTASGTSFHFSAYLPPDTYAHVTTTAQKEAVQATGNILSL